jgi:hypothetical protein
MVSRKHFQAIADAFKEQKPADHWDANKRTQWELDVKAVAKALATMNPRFNFSRFIAACGFEDEQKAA